MVRRKQKRLIAGSPAHKKSQERDPEVIRFDGNRATSRRA
jgi:hypothetical protein